MKRNQWLQVTHPIYDANVELWQQNELRMRGGKDIIDEELFPFDWELVNGDHYRRRKQSALYLNFAERFASIMVGHMMRQKPEPGGALNFGGLGQVPRERNYSNPSPAELVYYNADGIGNDGSQWDNYWTNVAKWAMATGHRWVLVEGPPRPPANRSEEINGGLRPFLSDYSPTDVLNWHFEKGRLSFAVIQRMVRKPVVGADGAMSGNEPELEYLVLTRKGYFGLGPEYADGGWFSFDAEGDIKDFGFWDRTNGEIPLFPLYYERIRPEGENPAISRPGTTELGNAAVGYMNLASAADFDVWDSATSVKALRGVDDAGFNLFIAKVRGGNRYAPLPANMDTQQLPDIVDASGNAIVSDSFDKRLTSKRAEALELMLNEMHAAPYASGESKRVTFTDSRAPRLASFAAEIENAQNNAIHYLEALWGKNPSGSVQWKRSFDLIDPIAAANLYFTMSQLAGIHSDTLDTEVMMAVAKASGWIGDDAKRQTIESEFMASGAKRQAMQDATLKTAQNPPKPVASGSSGK